MVNYIVRNEDEISRKLGMQLLELGEKAVRLRGVFRVGLSGGSLIDLVCKAIYQIEEDMSKWRFFFCDEGYVPDTDSQSTFGAYKSKLVTHSALEVEQFISINAKLPLEECAEDYEKKIRNEFKVEDGTIPVFDILLMRIGLDGHTCSLFPGHKLLEETGKLIASLDDAPKPLQKRVTMTYPLINKAKCCVFACYGSSKAAIIKRIFVDKDEDKLPAGLVNPIRGTLRCFFDERAGKPLMIC